MDTHPASHTYSQLSTQPFKGTEEDTLIHENCSRTGVRLGVVASNRPDLCKELYGNLSRMFLLSGDLAGHDGPPGERSRSRIQFAHFTVSGGRSLYSGTE